VIGALRAGVVGGGRIARVVRCPLLPVASLLLPLAASAAGADEFTLRDGTVLTAEELRDLGDRLEVRTAGGTRTLPKDQIRERARKKTPWEEFEAKFALLEEGDSEGNYLLGAWARERGLEGEARRAFRRAVAGDPENAKARTALGHVRVDGKWVAPAGEKHPPEECGAPVEGAVATPAERALGVAAAKRQSDHYRVESVRPGTSQRVLARYLDTLERAREATYAFLGEGAPPPGGPRAVIVLLRDRPDRPRSDFQRALDALVVPRVTPGGVDERLLRLEKACGFARLRDGTRGALASPFSDDETADRACLAHHAVHEAWLAEAPARERVPDWLTEAVAYVILNEPFPDDPAYCVAVGYGRPEREPDPWRNTRTWRGTARRLAAENRALDFASLSVLDLNSLTFENLIQAWSVLDALLARDGPGTRAYLRRVRRGADPREALKDILHLEPAGVDRLWRERALRK